MLSRLVGSTAKSAGHQVSNTLARNSCRVLRSSQRSVRTFCQKVEDKASKRTVQQRMQDASSDAKSGMKWLQLHFPQITAVAGGIIVVYGVSRFMVSMTNQFMATTLTDAAWMGFYGGFAAAGLSAGALFMISRALTIRPERVFRHALRRVQANEAAQRSLGLHIHSGELRAYTIRQGYMSLCDVTYRPTWVEPRVQMLFQVKGDFDDGMVTVEAKKMFPNRLQYSLVTVDPLRATSPMVLVEGDEERLHIRGQLRGFLQSERVPYIKQTEVDEDEAADVENRWEAKV